MPIKRRVFLSGLGGAGVGVGLGGLSHLFPLSSPTIGAEWTPGVEGFVTSTCMLCPSHCGIVGRIVDGSLVSIDGNPLHPVSRGGLCPKGKAGIQLLYHPARLQGPRQRSGGSGSTEFASTDWGTALERVATSMQGLRSSGRPEAVAWLVGDVGGSVGELLERFLKVYGTPHLLRESYRDGSDEVMSMSQGRAAGPAFDLDRSDMVVSFGCPLSEAWWSLPQAAGARDRSPGERRRWVQIDSRLSRTAVAADDWYPVRPDAYGALALSIAYVLLKEGMFDSEWIKDGVFGFDDWTDSQGQLVPGYRSLVLRFGRPDDLADRIGLPAERVVALAKEFGRAERPLAVWDQVVMWRRGGLATALAIHALNVLAGSLQRPGGVYVQPPIPFPGLPEMASAEAGSATQATLQADDWVDRVLEADRSPIEVLFLYHANPVASAPDPARVREALARIPLVVSFSPFLDESARHAHLVLPDHTYLERWQDASAPSTVPYPVWSVVQPMVPPLHDTRATGDVVLDLARRLGDPVSAAFPWPSIAALIESRGKALASVARGSVLAPAFRRQELREMETRGWWIPHGEDPGDFWKSLCDSGGWFDPYFDDHARRDASRRPDRRVAVFPEEARRKIRGGLPSLEEGFLPLTTRSAAESAEASQEHGELHLNPYRVMTLASGSTPLMPWLLDDLSPLTEAAWEPWVEINPETGRELGLTPHVRVRVRSDRGAFTARLRFYEGAQPGVLNAPYGLHTTVGEWGLSETANPLAAVGTRRDPITGLPDWYTTRVRIEPA